MPKISLVIPLYNAVKYIRPCLDSVALQTFKDFEAIIVDDGSTDETINIVAEYAGKYKNFILVSQSNSGVSSARNYGVQNSNSPWVAFLDQDDILHPQALEVLYFMAEKYDADIASFEVEKVNDGFVLNNPPAVNLTNCSPVLIENPVADFFRDKKGASIWVWNKLYRKDILKDVKFPARVQPAEDTVFTLKALFAAKSIVKVKDKLLFYRLSNTSVMKQGLTENYIYSHYMAAKEIFNYFSAKPNVDKQQKQWLAFYLSRFIFKSLVSQPLRRCKKNRQRLLSMANSYVEELLELKAFNPTLLGWRKNIACRFFAKSFYVLSRFFL